MAEQAQRTVIGHLSQADMEQLDKGLRDQEPSIHLECRTWHILAAESALSNINRTGERTVYLMLRKLVKRQFQHLSAMMVSFKIYTNLTLASVDEQKIQDRLLGASEISHSYNQKLLVMTDQEKSTNNRVQQEYSMDPHYSLIVSKECLYNESCLPEADSYTVVKIFGRVSDDGQTVSGLSGSSLAELVLKPSLEAAPVFSLDGNTTTHFQYNFIRVLVVRGNKAVLETNQENHQIYQVMDQHDSVSSSRIPQRPVDHTTQYDDQQILMMQDDPTVRKAAAYLYEKHPTVSSIYVLDENQRPKLIHGDSVPLSEDSKLVLVGHGVRDSSGEMRLAGHTAQDVAKIIAKTFRVGDTIKTTRVVACEVGSDKTFVETLLRELHEINIKTELHLSNTVIQVTHTGQKINNTLKPRRYIDRRVFQHVANAEQQENASYKLEALTWGFFHGPPPERTNINSLQENEHYVIGKYNKKYNMRWIKEVKEKLQVLSKCYEIKSGKDIRNMIHHYAVTRKEKVTYLMVNDWIYLVTPKTIYVYLVGKKLNSNDKISDVKKCIIEQIGKEKYPDMRRRILHKNIENPQERYAEFVRNIFLGEHTTAQSLSTEAWYTTYFTASVICESARNFRTFPLILMALDMVINENDNIRGKGLNFFFEDHPMARGGSWIDPSRRGFSGSATPQGSSKLYNHNPKFRKTEGQLMKDLRIVIGLEFDMFRKWEETIGGKNIPESMVNIAGKLKIFRDNSDRKGFLEVTNSLSDL